MPPKRAGQRVAPLADSLAARANARRGTTRAITTANPFSASQLHSFDNSSAVHQQLVEFAQKIVRNADNKISTFADKINENIEWIQSYIETVETNLAPGRSSGNIISPRVTIGNLLKTPGRTIKRVRVAKLSNDFTPRKLFDINDEINHHGQNRSPLATTSPNVTNGSFVIRRGNSSFEIEVPSRISRKRSGSSIHAELIASEENVACNFSSSSSPQHRSMQQPEAIEVEREFARPGKRVKLDDDITIVTYNGEATDKNEVGSEQGETGKELAHMQQSPELAQEENDEKVSTVEITRPDDGIVRGRGRGRGRGKGKSARGRGRGKKNVELEAEDADERVTTTVQSDDDSKPPKTSARLQDSEILVANPVARVETGQENQPIDKMNVAEAPEQSHNDGEPQEQTGIVGVSSEPIILEKKRGRGRAKKVAADIHQDVDTHEQLEEEGDAPVKRGKGRQRKGRDRSPTPQGVEENFVDLRDDQDVSTKPEETGRGKGKKGNTADLHEETTEGAPKTRASKRKGRGNATVEPVPPASEQTGLDDAEVGGTDVPTKEKPLKRKGRGKKQPAIEPVSDGPLQPNMNDAMVLESKSSEIASDENPDGLPKPLSANIRAPSEDGGSDSPVSPKPDSKVERSATPSAPHSTEERDPVDGTGASSDEMAVDIPSPSLIENEVFDDGSDDSKKLLNIVSISSEINIEPRTSPEASAFGISGQLPVGEHGEKANDVGTLGDHIRKEAVTIVDDETRKMALKRIIAPGLELPHDLPSLDFVHPPTRPTNGDTGSPAETSIASRRSSSTKKVASVIPGHLETAIVMPSVEAAILDRRADPLDRAQKKFSRSQEALRHDADSMVDRLRQKLQKLPQATVPPDTAVTVTTDASSAASVTATLTSIQGADIMSSAESEPTPPIPMDAALEMSNEGAEHIEPFGPSSPAFVPAQEEHENAAQTLASELNASTEDIVQMIGSDEQTAKMEIDEAGAQIGSENEDGRSNEVEPTRRELLEIAEFRIVDRTIQEAEQDRQTEATLDARLNQVDEDPVLVASKESPSKNDYAMSIDKGATTEEEEAHRNADTAPSAVPADVTEPETEAPLTESQSVVGQLFDSTIPFEDIALPNISKTSTFIANTPHPTVPKPKPEIKSLQLAAARKQQEMEKQRLKDENLKRQKQAMQRKLEEEQRKADDKKKDEDKKRSAESIQVAERDANLDKKRKIEKEPVKDRGREGQNSKPSTMAEYAKPAQISRIPSNMQPHSKAESSTKVPAPLVPNDRKESSSAAVDKPPDTKRPQAGLSKSASVLNPKTSGDQVPQSNAALQSVKTNLPPPPTIPIKNPYLSEITGSPLPRSKIPAIPPSPARSLQYCSSQISTFASLSQLPGTASSSQEPSSKGDTKVSGPSKTGEPIVESGVVTLVGDDGEIPDIHTSDEEDDEQPVAQWAASPLLMQSLERQMYKDPDEIFGMISPSGTREIFKGSGAKRMKQRRESAWGALDKLSAEEVSAYRKRMGFQ